MEEEERKSESENSWVEIKIV